MCLILFAWNPGSEEQLVVAANRDEFYKRPSQNAHFWQDNEQLLAGKDLQQHGTWLGVTRGGKFAAVTNFRRPDKKQYPLSRGALTAQYLAGKQKPADYLQKLQQNHDQYAGFNLLVGDSTSLYYYSNRSNQPPCMLRPGVYGLSNHLLNTPWPKVTTGVDSFRKIVSHDYDSPSAKEEALLKLLQNDQQAEESLLPETGVGKMIEKLLSPLFIKSPGYGTRASTVVRVQGNGCISFVEQSYSEGGTPAERSRFAL